MQSFSTIGNYSDFNKQVVEDKLGEKNKIKINSSGLKLSLVGRSAQNGNSHKQ